MFQDHPSVSSLGRPDVRTDYVLAYLGWKPSLLPAAGKWASSLSSCQLDRCGPGRSVRATGGGPVTIPRLRSSGVAPNGDGVTPKACKGNFVM